MRDAKAANCEFGFTVFCEIGYQDATGDHEKKERATAACGVTFDSYREFGDAAVCFARNNIPVVLQWRGMALGHL